MPGLGPYGVISSAGTALTFKAEGWKSGIVQKCQQETLKRRHPNMFTH